MTKKVPYSRSPWKDRFNQPTVEVLRKELAADPRRLFDQTRRKLLQLDGLQEIPSWHGDSWHWTLAYALDGKGDAVAILVPAPHDLQLAVPMDREFAESLPVSRLPRAVRDGLELAREPFDTRWAIWSITSSSLIEQLIDLVERKLRDTGKRAG